MPLTYDPESPEYEDVKALGHTMDIVNDLEKLTANQKDLVEYFEDRTSGKRFACRSDLNPMEIVKYIPNVILFDLVYDEQGGIDDVIFRLFGTQVANFYGDRTGQSIKDEDFQKTYPESNLRLLKEINFILETKKSITTVTKHYSKVRPYVNINTLKIPFSENGTDIDKIFMYFEQSTDV